MNKHVITLLILAGLAWLIGCTPKPQMYNAPQQTDSMQSERPVTSQEVTQEIQQAFETTSTYLTQESKDSIQYLQVKLDELGRRIEAFRKDPYEAEQPSKSQQVSTWQQQKDQLQESLNQQKLITKTKGQKLSESAVAQLKTLDEKMNALWHEITRKDKKPAEASVPPR